MRAASACLLFLVAASLASAQICTAPTTDVYSGAGQSNCTAITTCQTSLCACLGSSGKTAPACYASATVTCTAQASCATTYFACLSAITSSRSNSSDPCMTYGNGIYMAQLTAAASTQFNSTSLSTSCLYESCVIQNATNANTCAVAWAATCASSNLLPATTPGPSVIYAITATFRLSGSNWSYILNNATAYNALVADLKSDLAAYLGVNASFVVIISVSVGSLVVQFAVVAGSGVSTSVLQSQVLAVQTSTAFANSIANVVSLYSSVGTDSVAVTSVGVNQTSAPAPGTPGGPGGPPAVTPTPSPSSALGAAGVWAVAAVAAVAALLA